jgi:hypothetical protein
MYVSDGGHRGLFFIETTGALFLETAPIGIQVWFSHERAPPIENKNRTEIKNATKTVATGTLDKS